MAGPALHLCVGLWLVLHIVYTPIHLYRVPHSDEADYGAAAPVAAAAACVGDEDHDGDGHHERHSAAQHKFKVVNPERLVVAQMLIVPAAEWASAETDCPRPQVFEFSGLSPPELPRCWQFLFRTALRVRAPSRLS
jgi:hypothetical protein